MKTIIAGGRNYRLTYEDRGFLDTLGITEVVSGKCSGADSDGELWAGRSRIPVEPFPADWTKFGRGAGPLRNARMAAYADAVVLFPGDRGTESMFREATKAGIVIYDRRG